MPFQGTAMRTFCMPSQAGRRIKVLKWTAIAAHGAFKSFFSEIATQEKIVLNLIFQSAQIVLRDHAYIRLFAADRPRSDETYGGGLSRIVTFIYINCVVHFTKINEDKNSWHSRNTNKGIKLSVNFPLSAVRINEKDIKITHCI